MSVDDGRVEALSLWKGLVKYRPDRPSMREIAAEICQEYQVSLDELVGPSRRERYTIPRHDFMFRATEHFSLTQIGNFLGGRDHTTVLAGKRRHEKRLAEENAPVWEWEFP